MFYHEDISKKARENSNFRQEVVTGPHAQIVLMNIKPGEDIGMEVHKTVDQTLVFVEGSAKAELNGEAFDVAAGQLVFVPAGTQHDFTNTGNADLKLYTVYAPPQHAPGTVHATKQDAVEAEKEEHGS